MYKPSGFSYSYSRKIHDLEDLTDTEEDTRTIKARDFGRLEESDEDLDVFDQMDIHSPGFGNIKGRYQQLVPESVHKDTTRLDHATRLDQTRKSGEKKDHTRRTKGSRTLGYTILTTLILFISLHILPLLDWFPVLLRSRMGPHLSSAILFSLCATLGHQFSQSRRSYFAYYRSIKRKRSFRSVKRLILFVIGTYMTSYTTGYVFMGFYQVYSRVPVLGSLLIIMLLFWGSVLFGALSIWYGGLVSWSVAGTFVRKPVKKPTLHLVA